MLRIYNTLTRKKEEFRPMRKNRVNFFVCGPTVYDLSHIGHARTYVAFDVIVKYLRWRGYEVFYLQNITDVDDKIITRARLLSTAPLHLAQLEEAEYHADMQRLGVTSVSKYARASEHIGEIITQIETLLRVGVAYLAGGNVYFEIAKFPDYGKLSHQNLGELKNAVRTEKDGNKKNGLDFVIWKAKKPGEIFWHSPWGEGRPGWHIEDTAITEKEFGPQYDIHGAAQELMFPHHESEIALMESVSGRKPFVRYWMHTGHLTVRGKKMSKSLQNFITIRTFLDKFSPETLRLLVLSTHYRSPVDYHETYAKQASYAIERINEFFDKIQEVSKGKNTKSVDAFLKKTKENFIRYMDDDFNTPKALSVIFNLVKRGNTLLDQGKLEKGGAKKIIKVLREFDSVLGILKKEEPGTDQEMKLEQETMERIQKLVEVREKYRVQKNWGKADELREVLRLEGYWVDDAPSGPRIKRLNG